MMEKYQYGNYSMRLMTSAYEFLDNVFIMSGTFSNLNGISRTSTTGHYLFIEIIMMTLLFL